jgi:DivIVA domain-containing protein
MDASQSALDSLRTVEFRETLKGYHRDDVDEYLEKAAVEAEGLQEQVRQMGERLRQAGERIAQLEATLEERAAAEPAEPVVPDDTLQRTLLLAQRFVDETKADAEAHASKLVADAEEHARAVVADAEAKATEVASEAERRLREEIGRLETIKAQLSGDVEAMARHLEGERARLRSALTDVLRWVDENVKPASSLASARQRGDAPTGATVPTGPRPTGPAGGGQRPAAAPQSHAGAPGTPEAQVRAV